MDKTVHILQNIVISKKKIKTIDNCIHGKYNYKTCVRILKFRLRDKYIEQGGYL